MLKHALRTLAIVAAALTLAGCGGSASFDLAKAFGSASTATVDMTELSKRSHQARIAYLAFVQTATVYAKRPRCGAPTSPITCSDQAFLDGVVTPTVRSFGDATKASEDAVARLGSNPTLVAALVEAAVSSAKAADKVAANFR